MANGRENTSLIGELIKNVYMVQDKGFSPMFGDYKVCKTCTNKEVDGNYLKNKMK